VGGTEAPHHFISPPASDSLQAAGAPHRRASPNPSAISIMAASVDSEKRTPNTIIPASSSSAAASSSQAGLTPFEDALGPLPSG